MLHETVIKEIEKLLEVEDLPEETRAEIASGLAENILRRIIIDIVGDISEDEAATINGLLEKGDVDTALYLLKETHPLLDDKIKITSEEVIEEFMEAFHK